MNQMPIQAQIVYRDPDTLKPYERNARTHSKRQIRQITESIKCFGFVNPVLISDNDEIIAGYGREADAPEWYKGCQNTKTYPSWVCRHALPVGG